MSKQDRNRMHSGGVVRSFQGGGWMRAVGWAALHDDDTSYDKSITRDDFKLEKLKDADPNSHINAMLAKLISKDKEGVSVVNPNITSSGRSVSKLERLFKAIEPKADFLKFFDFLAHTAEAESFSGKVTENKNSSASGDFHILTDNTKGGGTSSFDTGKQRIRNLIKKSGTMFSNDTELTATLDNILKARSPAALTKEEQAMFVLIDLKMKSNNLKNFLSGKISDVDLYSKEWVTEGSDNHSKEGVIVNWKNADIRRSSNIDKTAADELYFGIKVRESVVPMKIKDEVSKIKFDQREKLRNLSPMYKSGGKIMDLEQNSAERLQNIIKRNKLF